MSDKPITSFDELESNLGNGEDFEEPKITEPLLLKTETVASLAYSAGLGIHAMANVHEADDSVIKQWDDLNDMEKHEYKMIVSIASRCKDQDDFCRRVHAKRAMHLLESGWSFSPVHSEDDTATWMVAPWESLPAERQSPLRIFHSVFWSLRSIWDEDNPHVKSR